MNNAQETKYTKRTTINALDPSQKYILDKITSESHVDDLSLVYGPPGTGKSHLIVSMLFELAYAKKKVLFVSQNREALDVVIRKFKDIDRAMGVKENDLSFLDLCLNLSDPSERTLKYIRGLRERLYKSTSPSPSTPGIDYGLPYALSYRNLDRNENWNISLSNNEIGIDELLTFDLEFIKRDKKLTRVPIRRIDEVDKRGVFDALRSYKEKADNFKEFCEPSGALRYLQPISSTTITIGKIQDPVQDIKDAIDDLGALGHVKCLSSNNIETALRWLSTISSAAANIDVVALKKDGVSFRQCYAAINSSKKYKSNMINMDRDLSAAKLPDQFIFGKKIEELLYDGLKVDEFDDRKKQLDSIERILKVKTSYGDDATFMDAACAIMKSCELNLGQLIGEYDFSGFGHDDIVTFLKDMEQWLSINGVARRINRLTGSVPGSLSALNDSSISYIWTKYGVGLKNVTEILNGTNYFVKNLVTIEKSNSNVFLDCNISNERKIELAHESIRLLSGDLEVLLKAKLCTVGYLKEKIPQWKKAIGLIEKLALDGMIPKSLGAKEAVRIINSAIHNQGKAKEIELLCSDYEKYYKIQSKDGLFGFLDKVDVLSDSNIGGYDIALSAFDFSEVEEIDNGVQEKIGALRDAVENARNDGVYSDEFFTLEKGEKISQWGDRINVLLEYENRNELQQYSEYSDFIRKLSDSLGESNKSYLQKYLSHGLEYEDFAANIAYDLIRCIYNDIPASQIKTIKNTKSYIEDFKTNLDKTRDRFYKTALMFMSCDQQREEAARNLATPRLMKDPSGGTMKKISANTDLIVGGYPVILATPSEVAKYIAPKKEIFDFVIFDEASQLLPGQAIPSIYRAKKAVIVGDPHQMPPTSTITIGGPAVAGGVTDELSILDLVKSMQIDAEYHLKVHYRSKYNVLFEPSRKAIYAQDDIRPIFEAKTTKMPLYIRDEIGENEEDIYRVAIDRINYYIGQNPKATFCVLFTQKSNYKNMATEAGFMRYLENAGDRVKNIVNKCTNEEILVSTITNCQGLSVDHSILCIPHYDAPRAMFFFKAQAGAYKRLNVSITRQKESLDIIMGDSRAKWINVCRSYMDDPDTAGDVALSAQLMAGLLENAGRQIDEKWLEEELGSNIDFVDSPLAKELYEELSEYLRQKYDGDVRVWCEVGYKLKTPDQESRRANEYNVGFRVDLGVYSRKHKRFILGIEMDGATYHVGFSKEFSDALRQTILEDKGWAIYRIWSTNWLEDKTGEFDKLVRTIDEIESKDPEPEEVSIVVADEDTNRTVEDNEDDEKAEEEQAQKPENSNEYIVPDDSFSRTQYWVALAKYCKECKRLGRVIEIKSLPNKDMSKENIDRILQFPYQKMIVVEVGDSYIMARPDGLLSHLKINMSDIVAYKD